MKPIHWIITGLFCWLMCYHAAPLSAQLNASAYTVNRTQTDISVSQDVLNLKLHNMNLSQALEELADQFNLGLAVNPDIIPAVQINQNLKSVTLEEALRQVLEDTPLTGFVSMAGNIIVKEKKEALLQTITGKVIDAETGEPLPGTNVLIKDTAMGTVTDIDGNYSLTIPGDAEALVFSFVGYQSLEVSITGRSVVDVSLVSDRQTLQDVVVIGYGTQEKGNVTGAIAQVKKESFQDMPVSSLDQGLAGQMAGVNVLQASGAPGSDTQINIRGIGTITAGSRPLIVMDGFPLSDQTDLTSLNPNDVESVEVLKDASAAAIYGSRGSNGVLLITTKKGQSGKTSFNFDAYYGIQQVAKTLDLMNAYEWSAWTKEARDNYYLSLDPENHNVSDPNSIRQANASSLGGNPKKVIIPDYIVPYLNNEQGLTDTDWQDEIFRNAPVQNYQISASGGSGDTRFFVSGNYFDQEGVVVGSDFTRYALRVNLESKLADRLKMGINFAPSYAIQNTDPQGWGDTPVTMALNSSPVFPAYTQEGELAISEQINQAIPTDQAQIENPVAFAKYTKDENKSTKLLGGFFLELELLEGLTAKSYLGIDYGATRYNYYRPSFIGDYRIPAPSIAKGSSATSAFINWINENTLTYKRYFEGGHYLDVVAGFSLQEEMIEWNQLEGTNFPNDQVPTLNAGTITAGYSEEQKWSLVSWLARANYNFKGKYLLSAAIRRDGSSRFGNNTKWGLFPSLSAGWRVSEESFFPQSGIVSDLKVRGSWGISGNNNIGNYGSQALLRSSNAIFDGVLRPGLSPATSPNQNLSWEETGMVDIGIDIGLFKDRLYLTSDYYSASSDGLLLEVPVPAHSGFVSSLQNLGSIKNSGFEFSLRGNYTIGKLKGSSSFNFSTNKNEVQELGPGQDQIITGRHITEVGGPLGAFYGYKVLGVFNSQEQLNNLPHRSDATLGDYIYADINKDGEISADDRTVLGDFFPDYSFGLSSTFSLNNFDLTFLIQGVQGVMVDDQYMSTIIYNPEAWGNGAKDYWENHYSPANPDAKYSRANPVPTDNGFYRNTDLLHDDASFIRLRNITLGYSLPANLAKDTFLENARIYITSKNLFTITDFRGYNPEQSSSNPLQPGQTLGSYPLEKSYVLGINLSF